MESNHSEFAIQPKTEQKTTINVIDISGKSVASERHRVNEDSFFFDKEKGIFGVFDGMGGETKGDIASSICSNSIKESLNNTPANISVAEAQKKLMAAFYDANKKVCLESEKNKSLVGTTGVFGILCHDKQDNTKAIVVNLGDSRAYRFRDGYLDPITLDDGILKFKHPDKARELQSKFSQITSIQGLSHEEIEDFNSRNMISNHFGVNDANPVFYTIDLKEGDRLLLCSDGVHDNLTDDEIADTLSSKNDSGSTVDSLVNKSLKRSKEHHFRSKVDDTTAMIIDFKESSPEVFNRKILQIRNTVLSLIKK